MSDDAQADAPERPPSAESSGPQVRSRWARLQWYRNRLAAMSGPEIVYRVEEAVKRRTARARRYDFRAWVRNDTLPVIPSLAEGIRRVGAAPQGGGGRRWPFVRCG